MLKHKTAAELNEAAGLPLDNVKNKCYEQGAGNSSWCPREGSVLLEAKGGGGVVIVNTTCHSWRCIGCRDRNRYRFKRMVESGLSGLTRSLFITITYKAGSARLMDAGCVSRDWKALWRAVKKKSPSLWGLPMLRVMELTKKGTPHFHVVIGNIPEGMVGRCYGKTFDGKAYKRALDSCECVSHVLGRIWREVQGGESWIVHVVPVAGAKGAGSYLAKYVGKELDGERMKMLGMARRWSATRNWPRETLPSLTESARGWARHIWTPGHVNDLEKLQRGFGDRAKHRTRTEAQESTLRKILIKRYVKLGGHGDEAKSA